MSGGAIQKPLFDVVAVNIETGAERFLTQGVTEENAEACIAFAIMRRGLDEEFYKAVPTSLKHQGGAS